MSSIEELEAEITASKFEVSDAERFLIDHHKSKIQELTQSESKWARHWSVAKAGIFTALAYLGFTVIVLVPVIWALKGY